jgi:SM-20-related protein
MSEMLDLDNLRGAETQSDPFQFLVVPGFLKAEAQDAAIADFPVLPEPRNHKLAELEFGPAFARLLEDLGGSAWVTLLGEKLGVPDLSSLPCNITVRGHSEASDGHIHADHWSKVVTVLIYLNHEWTSNGGKLRMLRSESDLEDYACEVSPDGGNMVAFVRSPNSFHGHHKHVGRRRVIQVSWLRPNAFARAWQGLARRGTQLAKRLGLHPND